MNHTEDALVQQATAISMRRNTTNFFKYHPGFSWILRLRVSFPVASMQCYQSSRLIGLTDCTRITGGAGGCGKDENTICY